MEENKQPHERGIEQAHDEPDSYDFVVPGEVLEQIPAIFAPAMIGELIGIYGLAAFTPDEDGVREYEYHLGSFGWSTAFWMACKKLDMKWLFDYYDKLEWFESDVFDDAIRLILNKAVTSDWNGYNYFQYMQNYHLEEECGYPRWMN